LAVFTMGFGEFDERVGSLPVAKEEDIEALELLARRGDLLGECVSESFFGSFCLLLLFRSLILEVTGVES